MPGARKRSSSSSSTVFCDQDPLLGEPLRELLSRVALMEKIQYRHVSKKWMKIIDSLLSQQSSVAIADKSKVMDKENQIYGHLEEKDVIFFRNTFTSVSHIGIGCELSGALFWDLLKSCHELNSVTLNGDFVNITHMNAMAEFSKLRTVRIQNSSITDNELQSFLVESRKLQSLSLEDMPHIEGHCFNLIPNNFTALRVVNCPKIDGETWNAFTHIESYSICRLTIHNCFLDNNSFAKIASKLRRLNFLDLRFPLGSQSDTFDIKRASCISNLTALHICDESDSPLFNEKHLSEITRNCYRLSNLQLVFKANAKIDFKQNVFEEIHENCDKIAFLSLTAFVDITTQLKQCKYLKELQFASMSSSDESFRNVLCDTLSLRKVTFTDCKNVGLRTLAAVSDIASKQPKCWIYFTVIKSGIEEKTINSYFEKQTAPNNLVILLNNCGR